MRGNEKQGVLYPADCAQTIQSHDKVFQSNGSDVVLLVVEGFIPLASVINTH
jgi:hypothetical protein